MRAQPRCGNATKRGAARDRENTAGLSGCPRAPVTDHAKVSLKAPGSIDRRHPQVARSWTGEGPSRRSRFSLSDQAVVGTGERHRDHHLDRQGMQPIRGDHDRRPPAALLVSHHRVKLRQPDLAGWMAVVLPPAGFVLKTQRISIGGLCQSLDSARSRSIRRVALRRLSNCCRARFENASRFQSLGQFGEGCLVTPRSWARAARRSRTPCRP